MAVYGITVYGTQTYGYDIPPQYRVDPFTAFPVDYKTIMVSWNKPAGTILGWRLLKNKYGFPTDQDDGEILIDTTSGYPGNSFADTTPIPGTYQYYGFYVLVNSATDQWVRSGLTACLAPANYGTGKQIHELMPSFYHLQGGLESEIISTFGSDILDVFLNVFGWGMDYLRTQYDTYVSVNDPWKISISDLFNLANQLGININPDIHPFTLRKAVYYNAQINHQKGTLPGIAQELSVLTGWSADVQIGNNLMLDNDQSAFSDPFFPLWSANLSYNVGEQVTFGNFFYQCIATGNLGHAPSGTSISNTWWQAILGVNNAIDLLNSSTGGISTWELLYPSATNGVPTANKFFETLGVADPLNASSFTHNSLQGINGSGSSTTMWLRSLARTTTDLLTVTTTFAPDIYQTVADGIPVPSFLPDPIWSAGTRYETDQIVTNNNQSFIALRASTGIAPPYLPVTSTNEAWAPVSLDQRFRICVSAYVTGSSAVPVYPFVEWYDSHGNFITRIIARNPIAGTAGILNQFAYDSFTSGAGNSLSGRKTDDGSSTWVQMPGTFKVSPFGTGSVYPLNPNQRTYAILNVASSANCQVGVTFVTSPAAGLSSGLVLRFQDDANYLRADSQTLKLKQSGVWSTLGTFSTAFQPGDRMVAQLNGSSITILRNNASVLSVTSSFNTAGTTQGIIVEPT